MVNRRKPKTILRRWDANVFKEVKNLLPDSTDAEMTRILYNTSLLKAEKGVRNLNDQLEEYFGIQKKTKKK